MDTRFHPVPAPGADVLADIGRDRIGECHHRQESEVIDFVGGIESGHEIRLEAVDQSLEHDGSDSK